MNTVNASMDSIIEPTVTGSADDGNRRRRFCDHLVDQEKLDPSGIERALRLQREQANRERIGAILIKLGLVSERDVAEVLSRQLDLPLVEIRDFPEEWSGESTIALRFLRENRMFILDEKPDSLTVAMGDPYNDYALEALRLFTGKQVVPRVGIPSEIEIALERHETRERGGHAMDTADDGLQFLDDVEHLKEQANEGPVIKMVNQLLHRAVDRGASDIHIEPFENRLKVRYRIDGLLREVDAPPARSVAAVISRVKIMANLNIAERRLSQDGRFKLRMRGNDIDFRVSTVPTLYGESVVLRLLHRDDVALDFGPLGFSPAQQQVMNELLALPHGIILVTGPTGSGKSTTLYAAIKHLNTPERMIITVEDPVEYYIDGVNQMQVKPQIGLTFANALRSIVRQDPDVIMIGEMRDPETARIAVQSALTGHLVFSTLHTNDAVGSITRLLDMNIDDYLLTSTVSAVLAQRLVRTLCRHCREAYTPMPEVVRRWRLERFSEQDSLMLYRAVGCDHCGGTGYAGRIAILELMVMNDTLRQLVLEHADAGMIARSADAQGMEFMFDDGLRKVAAGITTIEEVLRVTQELKRPPESPVTPAVQQTGRTIMQPALQQHLASATLWDNLLATIRRSG
jgi:general secretion pathway protein E